MSDEEDNNLIEKLKSALDSLVPSSPDTFYPPGALPMGTFVRSNRLDRLGIVTDAFYDNYDNGNQRVIAYSILLLPKRGLSHELSNQSLSYYIVNEYEYDITAYLMIKPADMSKLNSLMDGNLF